MTGSPSVAERKALLWYRVHAPSADYERDQPPLVMRMRLLQRGWIRMAVTARKRGDPMVFEISDDGRKALDYEPPKPAARPHLED